MKNYITTNGQPVALNPADISVLIFQTENATTVMLENGQGYELQASIKTLQADRAAATAAVPAPETRQQAAEKHPLWKAFLAWDAERQCAPPDMNKEADRLQFEAFVTGHELASAAAETAWQLLRDIYDENGRHFHMDPALSRRLTTLLNHE
jgi:hypothetical protein